MIYAGRVTQPQKRVWYFVPLVEHLLRMRVPFVFDIVGHGDEFGSLQHFLRARVPAADVRFHGRVPHHEMGAKWLAHDVFIQVSDFEGTSVSMLEAMAHGAVPVVTAASSGIDGVVIPGENGFVVPLGDMAAMAEAIAQLDASRPLLAKLGAAAYQSAQAYSMERYVEKLCGVLDAAAAMEMRSRDHESFAIGAAVRPMVAQRQMMREQREALQRVMGRRGR
jgi:glycosyltransferase involved in cell wall biosynthesis